MLKNVKNGSPLITQCLLLNVVSHALKDCARLIVAEEGCLLVYNDIVNQHPAEAIYLYLPDRVIISQCR